MLTEEIYAGTHAFFRDGTSDGGALHLTLGIYDDTGIILPVREMCVRFLAGYTYLKVEEETITSTPGFALADDDGRHRWMSAKWVRASVRQKKKNIRTLLTKFWFSLLHGCYYHVTDTSIRKTIQMRPRVKGFNDK